jgi:hypothetical protein
VKPTGSGVWRIFIGHQGKRRAKKVGDKKLAMDAAKKIQPKLTLGDVGIVQEQPKVPTLENRQRNGQTSLCHHFAGNQPSLITRPHCAFMSCQNSANFL